jgi:hypothetical protein
MYETYTDFGIFLREMMCQMFRAIDRTVLASRAAEAHHEACEPTARICLDMRVHDPVYMFKETYYLPSSSRKRITGSSRPVSFLYGS